MSKKKIDISYFYQDWIGFATPVKLHNLIEMHKQTIAEFVDASSTQKK